MAQMALCVHGLCLTNRQLHRIPSLTEAYVCITKESLSLLRHASTPKQAQSWSTYLVPHVHALDLSGPRVEMLPAYLVPADGLSGLRTRYALVQKILYVLLR